MEECKGFVVELVDKVFDNLSKLKERRAKENARKKKREISEIKKAIKKTDSLVK